MNDWLQRVTPELRRLQLHVFVGNPGSGGAAVNQIPAANGCGPRDTEVYGKAIAGSGRVSTGGVLA